MRRHFVAVAPVDNDRLGGTQAFRSASHINGGIATAIHHHAPTQQGFVFAFHGTQHGYRIQHLGGITGRNVGPFGNVGAHGQKHRVKTTRLFGLEHVVHLGVVLNAHTQVHNALHLGVQHLARQAVLRNAKTHHAARQRPGFDHGDRMAHACQLVSRRQT